LFICIRVTFEKERVVLLGEVAVREANGNAVDGSLSFNRRGPPGRVLLAQPEAE